MSESKSVYRAPWHQLVVGLGFAVPYLLGCSFGCAVLVAKGNIGLAGVFLAFTAFGAFMIYNLGWRVARELELTTKSLRWRAAFRRGEVAIDRIRDINRIGQRSNSSWKLDVADGSPIYVAASRRVGPFLAAVERTARAAAAQNSGVVNR